MKWLKTLIEFQLFGICTRVGENMGISTKRIRIFFIYISFIGIGSPVVLYLILGFWLNLKNYWLEKRTAVWDI